MEGGQILLHPAQYGVLTQSATLLALPASRLLLRGTAAAAMNDSTSEGCCSCCSWWVSMLLAILRHYALPMPCSRLLNRPLACPFQPPVSSFPLLALLRRSVNNGCPPRLGQLMLHLRQVEATLLFAPLLWSRQPLPKACSTTGCGGRNTAPTPGLLLLSGEGDIHIFPKNSVGMHTTYPACPLPRKLALPNHRHLAGLHTWRAVR